MQNFSQQLYYCVTDFSEEEVERYHKLFKGVNPKPIGGYDLKGQFHKKIFAFYHLGLQYKQG